MTFKSSSKETVQKLFLLLFPVVYQTKNSTVSTLSSNFWLYKFLRIKFIIYITDNFLFFRIVNRIYFGELTDTRDYRTQTDFWHYSCAHYNYHLPEGLHLSRVSNRPTTLGNLVFPCLSVSRVRRLYILVEGDVGVIFIKIGF